MKFRKRHGLDVDDWGPHGWHLLHACAHSAPPDMDAATKEAWETFLRSFQRVMPCKTCARHFDGELNAVFPEGVVDRETLVKGLNTIHNQVNRKRGKRTYSLVEHHRLYASPSYDLTVSFEEIVMATSVLAIAVLLSSEFKKSSARFRR